MPDRERTKRRAAPRPAREDNVVRVTFEEQAWGGWFVVFEKNGENIAIDFGLCEFEEDMAYWGFDVKAAVKGGRAGFVIAGTRPRTEVEAEIDRFILQYDLGLCSDETQ